MHPVRLVVDDDLRRSRPTVLLRALLALPHLLVLGVVAGVVALLLPVQWVATLVTGTPQRQLHELNAHFVRYALHVAAYLSFAAGPYPPFIGVAGGYAVDVALPEPERQSRWTVGFRGVLAVPPILLASALGAGPATLVIGYLLTNVGAVQAVSVLAFFSCLARGRMPRGFRDLLVYALGYGAQTSAYALLVTGRFPTADTAAVPGAELPDHPVALSAADDDLRRNRLMVLFRLPLTAPHFVWLLLWEALLIPAALAGWLCALVLGRLPRPLHRFAARWVRYAMHVYAFVSLAGNPFPGFTGRPGSYPLELALPEPERQSRWAIGFRALLVFPAFVTAGALGGAAQVAAILGWFAALFTGRMPNGLRNLIAWALRYDAQVYAYALLLTPRYPYSGPGPCDRAAPEPA